LGALIVWFLRRDLPESPRWFEIRHRTVEADIRMKHIEQQAMREHTLHELGTPELVVVEPQTKTPLTEIFSGIYAQRTIMLWIFQILQTAGSVRERIEQQMITASSSRSIYRISLEANPAKPGELTALELFIYKHGKLQSQELFAYCSVHGEHMQ